MCMCGPVCLWFLFKTYEDIIKYKDLLGVVLYGFVCSHRSPGNQSLELHKILIGLIKPPGGQCAPVLCFSTCYCYMWLHSEVGQRSCNRA